VLSTRRWCFSPCREGHGVVRQVKLRYLIPILGILFALSGCSGAFSASSGGGSCSEASPVVNSAVVFPVEPNLLPGESKPLATEMVNACGFVVSGATMGWTSSNPTVVSVDSAGHLTAQAIGTAAVIGRLIAGPGGRGLQSGEASVSVEATVRVVSARTGDAKDLLIFPSDPKGVLDVPVQLTAVPVDRFGNMVPGTTIEWTSDNPFAASIIGAGLVAPTQIGQVGITAHLSNAGVSPVSLKTTQLTVQAVTGAAPPPPNVSILPASMTMYVGQVRTVQVSVTDPLTGEPVPASITWQMTPVGVVSLEPLIPPGDQARLTGLAAGSVQLVATATTSTATVVSDPAVVTVLSYDALIPGTWTRTPNLPIDLSHHRMSAVNGHLFVTGGVGSSFMHGGPVEDVFRALIYPGGLLSDPLDPLSPSWWDHSYHYPSTDPKIRNFGACSGWDPACLYIWREAHGQVFAQYVHYQVFDHAQTAWSNHIYLAGGVDAQVDLGVQPEDPNAVGPDITNFSDRILMGDVWADGTLIDWRESPSWRIPDEGVVGPNLLDVPGRSGSALAVHGQRLYLTGGWGWAQDMTTLSYTGRNHDTVWVTDLDPITGEPLGWRETTPMPEPLNRHAMAVVGDWLVVSGGVTGIDQTVVDEVRATFRLGRVDPATGHISRWNLGRSLPKPLSRHAMLAIPGTNYLLVIGGDDLYSASPDVYLTDVNPYTGAMGGWRLLPPVPAEFGLTGMAAEVVMGDNNGTPVARVYVSGGGPVATGGPANYEIGRGPQTWMLQFTPP